MSASTVLSGLGFYAWYPKAAKKVLSRALKRIVVTGGFTFREPLNPEVAIILVHCPDWPSTDYTLTVEEPERSALQIGLLNDWTPVDLVTHFARVAGSQSSEVAGSGSGVRRRRVFNMKWLDKVLTSGKKLPSDGRDLPFPEYEIRVNIKRASTTPGPVASTSAAAAPTAGPSAFLWAAPQSIEGAWIPGSDVNLALGVPVRVSAHDPEEWERWKRNQRPETAGMSIPSHRIPRPNLVSILARPSESEPPPPPPSPEKGKGRRRPQ